MINYWITNMSSHWTCLDHQLVTNLITNIISYWTCLHANFSFLSLPTCWFMCLRLEDVSIECCTRCVAVLLWHCRHWMPALVLIGYWALFNAATFIALQYLPGVRSMQCLSLRLP